MIDDFLIHATADPLLANGPAQHRRRARVALRMLQRHPEFAKDSIYSAVICGDLTEVKRILKERPEAATEPGGAMPRRQNAARETLWTPLLHLCYGRLPLPAVAENSVTIARLLLDHGADPNDFFECGSNPCRYTALCGVIGEGEDDAPPHAQRDALAKLLLDHGAQPYDTQLFYNIHFRGDILWLMQLIYETSVARGRKSDWDDPLCSMLDIGVYGSGARYLLNIAVTHNNLALAEWMLSHGATPNPPPANHPNLSQLSLYQEALNRNYLQMAELLARYGATTEGIEFTEIGEFSEACLMLDRVKAEAILKEHPEFRQRHEPLFAAAERDRVDAVELLLDLGTSIEAEDKTKQRALHVTVGHDAINVARLLVARGAQLDAVETNWQSTPFDQALYGDRTEMIEFLGSVSNDIYRVAWAGDKKRLLELLEADPDRAKENQSGVTPLMWLPDDEKLSLEMARILISHGADPNVKDSDGHTAADIAQRRALYDTAEFLRAQENSNQTPTG